MAFDSSGRPANVEPEKSLNFEVGIKSQLWNRRVTLNANLYHTKVRDYQNVTSEADPTSPTGYSSRLGNIPGVRAQGAEFDAYVNVTERLQLTAGGAYNDAIYTDWATATCPRSFPSTVAFCDNTGKQIVGAGVTHGTSGAEYELSVIAKNVFDTRYTTSVNDFSNSAPVGYDGIGARRYVGVVLRAKF